MQPRSGILIGPGLAIGAALGIVIDNLAIGIALGVVFGLAGEALMVRKRPSTSDQDSIDDAGA